MAVNDVADYTSVLIIEIYEFCSTTRVSVMHKLRFRGFQALFSGHLRLLPRTLGSSHVVGLDLSGSISYVEADKYNTQQFRSVVLINRIISITSKYLIH